MVSEASLYNRVRMMVLIVMLAVGISSFVRGWSYLPAQAREIPPGGIQLIAEEVSLTVWAIGWIIAAGATGVGMLFVHPKPWLLAPAIGMCGVWAVAYYVSFVQSCISDGPMNRDYLAGTTYAGMGWLIYGASRLAVLALTLARRIEPTKAT